MGTIRRPALDHRAPLIPSREAYRGALRVFGSANREKPRHWREPGDVRIADELQTDAAISGSEETVAQGLEGFFYSLNA
jgi:hypothetical protein